MRSLPDAGTTRRYSTLALKDGRARISVTSTTSQGGTSRLALERRDRNLASGNGHIISGSIKRTKDERTNGTERGRPARHYAMGYSNFDASTKGDPSSRLGL